MAEQITLLMDLENGYTRWDTRNCRPFQQNDGQRVGRDIYSDS